MMGLHIHIYFSKIAQTLTRKDSLQRPRQNNEHNIISNSQYE